ncbi:M48 family metallopeptidase [Diaphorobacter sp. JS3051]|uniref:M48 family metallopeptidase n=1 Tax=Diaphorobacter sp. JS3051 TaxID=2792224 RepID=UPI0018C95C8F|nr:SprT family zinc-dependent metalloprotease [Diaphorobacter sp. JS3051]QPN29297.1 M48 family metallopeptidase [Diaphorobacter sp. JS3051]
MQRLVQLALDFLGGGSSPDSEVPQPKRAMAPVQQAPEAPLLVAPAPPLGDLLTPAVFRHPAASREVLLGDAVVAYALQRARRRSIGFTVGPDGLSVRAPSWVTLAGVDAALRDKAPWILRKLGEQQARRQQEERARIVWGDGAVLPYLGEPLTVVLDPTHGFAARGGVLEGQGATGRALRIALARSAAPAQVRDAVQAWLMRDARRCFTERLHHFAPLLDVRWTRLRLSSANTRWGSARADGSIRLNWRLMHYRPAIIDYVVAHELSHLRVMDHSPRFWDTVATVVPDYAALRRSLREQPAPPWD